MTSTITNIMTTTPTKQNIIPSISMLSMKVSSPSQMINTNGQTVSTPTDKKNQSTSWLLRFFESKHFDMSIAISYLFNTKEPGVQTYLCNRLFTFTNQDVDFYLPQLLNIYIFIHYYYLTRL